MISTYRSHIITGVICLVTGIGIGLAIGWKMYHPEVVIEGYKPEIVFPNGSVALERKPDQPPPPALKEAAKKLDGKLERVQTIKLQPKPIKGASEGCECEEINLEVGTVDTGDGKRAIVHTDDATVIGGTDIPLEPYQAERKFNWEVGAIVPLENPEGVGPYVSRKLGPFSVGIQATQPSREEGWTAMATVGIRF